MNEYAGYLVVLNPPNYYPRSPNKQYRGLYRTPPYREEDAERGFEHPLVFGGFTNEAGLIADLATARQVLSRFGEVERGDRLEIIHVRSVHGNRDQELNSGSGLKWIGYDVACLAPFWSILVDWVPAELPASSLRFNRYGLLNSLHDANMCLKGFRLRRPEDKDIVLYIWQVSLVG